MSATNYIYICIYVYNGENSPLPLIQEGLLSVTSESICTKYWLTA